jgi:hypothetical protein
VIIFENFSFALFTPPLGDFQTSPWGNILRIHWVAEGINVLVSGR